MAVARNVALPSSSFGRVHDALCVARATAVSERLRALAPEALRAELKLRPGARASQLAHGGETRVR
jgi:hypothetical protein